MLKAEHLPCIFLAGESKTSAKDDVFHKGVPARDDWIRHCVFLRKGVESEGGGGGFRVVVRRWSAQTAQEPRA